MHACGHTWCDARGGQDNLQESVLSCYHVGLGSTKWNCQAGQLAPLLAKPSHWKVHSVHLYDYLDSIISILFQNPSRLSHIWRVELSLFCWTPGCSPQGAQLPWKDIFSSGYHDLPAVSASQPDVHRHKARGSWCHLSLSLSPVERSWLARAPSNLFPSLSAHYAANSWRGKDFPSSLTSKGSGQGFPGPGYC